MIIWKWFWYRLQNFKNPYDKELFKILDSNFNRSSSSGQVLCLFLHPISPFAMLNNTSWIHKFLTSSNLLASEKNKTDAWDAQFSPPLDVVGTAHDWWFHPTPMLYQKSATHGFSQIAKKSSIYLNSCAFYKGIQTTRAFERSQLLEPKAFENKAVDIGSLKNIFITNKEEEDTSIWILYI